MSESIEIHGTCAPEFEAVRAAFERVPADRVAGTMPRLPSPARCSAPMPPRPADVGAKVAGGAVPRYEKTTPEIADAAPRAERPGV